MITQGEIYKRRWIILSVILLATFMSCLDTSIVNIVLPMISKNLQIPMALAQWVSTIYLLVISGAILTFGRLGDILGKANVFKFGIVVFTIGSLLCALSDTIIFLLIARVIQSIGAGCVMATNKGLTTAIFDKNERGKALGLTSSVVAIGTMLGPALGGIIAEYKWNYIFTINIPLGIIAIILAFKILPTVEMVKKKEPLDIKGTLLFFIAIVSLITAITEGSIFGYLNPYIISGYIIGMVTLILFVKLQIKIKYPLLDFNIFKNHEFTKGMIASFLMYAAINAYIIIFPFYYESVRGFSSGLSGVFMLSYPLAISIFAPICGSLSDKFRKDIFPFIGLILCALGFFLVSTISINTNIYLILIYLSVIGVGNGFFQSPMNSIVMSSVSKDKLGIAGSVNAFVRNIGMVCGITFSTSLLYDLMSKRLGYTVRGVVKGQYKLFIQSMDIVYIVSALICVVGVVILLSLILKANKNKRFAKEGK